jgi:hypothetical protein
MREGRHLQEPLEHDTRVEVDQGQSKYTGQHRTRWGPHYEFDFLDDPLGPLERLS